MRSSSSCPFSSQTVVDPKDPKGKQQAIHVAPSFADYLKAQADKKAAEGN